MNVSVPKLICIILTVLLTGVSGCRHEVVLSTDEIIARNTEAMGGRQAIEAVHSIEITLHISETKFDVDAVYRAARPGAMRIDVTAGGKRVFSEGFDGEKAWQWPADAEHAVDESLQATAALRHGVELPGKLFGLHEMRGRGDAVEFVGRERLDGTDFYVLRATLRDGYSTSLYVDPATWRITRRRDFRPLHVDVDPTPTTIEDQNFDFRQEGGVWFAFGSKQIDVPTGKVMETSRIETVKINSPVDQKIFGRP
jgi:hypothetical protein